MSSFTDEELLQPREGEAEVFLARQNHPPKLDITNYYMWQLVVVLRMNLPGLYRVTMSGDVETIRRPAMYPTEPKVERKFFGIDTRFHTDMERCDSRTENYVAGTLNGPARFHFLNALDLRWLDSSASLELAITAGKMTNGIIRAARLRDKEVELTKSLLFNLSPPERRKLLAEFTELRSSL